MDVRVATLLYALTLGLTPGSAVAAGGDSASASRLGMTTVVFGGPSDVANNPGHLDHERPHALIGVTNDFPIRAGFTAGVELHYYRAGYDTPPLAPPFAGTYSPVMNLEVLGIGVSTGWSHAVGIVRPFARAGVGAYAAVLAVDNLQESSFGTKEHYDHAGFDLSGGADLVIRGHWLVQVAARKLWLHAELPKLAGGEVRLDAESVTLGIGRAFFTPARRRAQEIP